MSRVTVTEPVYRWAIERAQRGGVVDLPVKFPKIQEWISGETQPTLRQLEGFARATYTPLGFFFLEEPPEERMPIPYFRTIRSDVEEHPSPNLLETTYTMELRQAWMREYLIDEGEEPLAFVKSAKTGESPAIVADRMREALGFEAGWAAGCGTWSEALGLLREAIEGTGVMVAVSGVVGNNTHRKLDVEEFRGFVLVDDYAPLVFVNGADFKGAQMFTLAHELAHVFFGSSAAFDLREMQPADNPTEQACNRVAAEFLVPERTLREVWPAVAKEPKPFDALARRFRVSGIVTARRALDLCLISKDSFFEYYNDRKVLEQRAAPGGGDFYANQKLRLGGMFTSALVNAVQEGKLLHSEAYRLTGLRGKTFDGYLASLGIGEKG